MNKIITALAVCFMLAACGTTERQVNAETVVTELQDAGLPVEDVTVFTAETDPNDLLGRPGGYESKAAWVDDRVDPADAPGGETEGNVALGGGVEVFDNAADARERAEYISGLLGGSTFLGTEYTYVADGVLLRLSGELEPDQADDYTEALEEITGTEPELIEGE